MKSESYGVWAPEGVLTAQGGWMHCPLSGEQIRGSRVRMRQYAKDMNYLGFHVRPKGKATTGFVCRKRAPRREGVMSCTRCGGTIAVETQAMFDNFRKRRGEDAKPIKLCAACILKAISDECDALPPDGSLLEPVSKAPTSYAPTDGRFKPKGMA